MSQRQPSDIARDAFKQLAARRLAPTPANYQMLYDEVSGAATPTPFPDAALRKILRVMPGQTAVQQRLLGQLEGAIAQHDWTALQGVLVAYANLGLKPAATALAEPPIESSPSAPKALSKPLAEPLARLLEQVLPMLDSSDTRVHLLGQELVQFLRLPAPSVDTLENLLGNFSYRLSFASEDQSAIRSLLLDLLRMVFENMAALSQDDRWLHGQAEALRDAASQPLSVRQLDGVQRRLKDVIFKQTEAKGQMVEAQVQMKQMLSTFIERLTSMTESSSVHHTRMGACAERVALATTLSDITPVLEEVMGATRALALDGRIAHDELASLRERTELKHGELERLQQQLDEVSAQARHDPLTGSLNRKGLDEALERELARARRADSPLCLALLDVDNFKLINDRLGHSHGDSALVHLADVVRSVVRPQDVLARYGGEEFVLLLPDTAVAHGVDILQRLQRELTQRFFLANNDKVLITFSAGVAQVHASETGMAALQRADQAMYLAKRNGKNRVIAA